MSIFDKGMPDFSVLIKPYSAPVTYRVGMEDNMFFERNRIKTYRDRDSYGKRKRVKVTDGRRSKSGKWSTVSGDNGGRPLTVAWLPGVLLRRFTL